MSPSPEYTVHPVACPDCTELASYAPHASTDTDPSFCWDCDRLGGRSYEIRCTPHGAEDSVIETLDPEHFDLVDAQAIARALTDLRVDPDRAEDLVVQIALDSECPAPGQTWQAWIERSLADSEALAGEEVAA